MDFFYFMSHFKYWLCDSILRKVIMAQREKIQAAMLPDIRGLMTTSTTLCLKPLTMVCMLHWILILYILYETAVRQSTNTSASKFNWEPLFVIILWLDRQRKKNRSNRKFYNGKFSLQNKDRWSKSGSACLEGKKNLNSFRLTQQVLICN